MLSLPRLGCFRLWYLSQEAAVPSGVHQDFVIEPLLFLVMVNNVSDILQLFCWLFANNKQMRGKSALTNLIQADLDKMAAQTVRNTLFLDAIKTQQLNFR